MKIFFREAGHAATGGSYGFRTHEAGTRAALERAGVLVDDVADADAALWVGPPDNFHYLEGARNVLFTAVEGAIYPKQLVTPDLKRPELLVVVPCSHNQAVMRRVCRHVEVAALGVDGERFFYVERRAPHSGDRFRFLWLGNLVPAKGPLTLIEAFKRWHAAGTMPPNCEVYLKTAAPGRRNGKPWTGLAYEVFANGEWRPALTPAPIGSPQILVDNRNLPVDELHEIYATASCFVMPSAGEGFCLPLAESMASGTPCIATAWSAMTDYFDESVGFPLVEGEDFEVGPVPGSYTGQKAAIVNPLRLAEKMAYVYSHYDQALKRGRRAAEKMRSYSWDATAARIIEACERFLAEEATPEPPILTKNQRRHLRRLAREAANK